MRRSLLTPRRALALVTVLLVVTSLLPSRVVTWVGTPAHNLVSALMIPLSVPLHSIAQTLRRPTPIELDIEDPHHPGHEAVYRRQLEQEVAALREQVREFGRIRDVLGDEESVRAVTARVAGPTADRLNPTLPINRGTRDGVARGQAVVTGFALVGEIEQAGPVSADVRLFTAAETRLEVRLVPPVLDQPTRDYEAWMQISDEGRTFVIEAERDDPVDVGDWAHLADERWPRESQGFVVARVTDVSRDPSDPYRLVRVTLEPVVELRALRQVTVLVVD